MEKYNDMQLLKRRMFAMRNGVIADVLRKAGSPFSIIFGLNVPQLAEIAMDMPHTKEFAEKVWSNTTTRESMLVAPMLMPVEEFPMEEAMRWVCQANVAEVIDILCLKLLRHEPYAFQLVEALIEEENDMKRYAGLRLLCNLAPKYPEYAASVGEKELQKECALTRQAAMVLKSYGEI